MQSCSRIFLVLLFSSLYVKVCASELNILIKNYTAGIGAGTCIYYNYAVEAHNESSETWQQCSAQILLNKQPSIPFFEYFHSNILNVVFLTSAPVETQLENFKYATQRWHSRDVLFVVAKNGNSALSVYTTAYALFNWCWHNGYSNVLLTDASGNELLTYQPFPAVRLSNITLHAYLNKRNAWWRNFYGYPLRAVSGTQPPRAIIHTDEHGEQQISGLKPLIIKLFAERYNATLNFTVDPNPDYDCIQCIPEVLDGLYDICADSGFYRAYNKPHSKPLHLDVAYFAVRFPQPLAKFRYFLAPFQAATWWLFIITIAYITLLLAVSNWYVRGHWEVGQYLLDVISSFINASVHANLINERCGVCVFALLTVAGFIISNYYLAFLSSLLSTNLYEYPIENVEDIIAANITVLTVPSYDLVLHNYSAFKALRIKYIEAGALKVYRDRLDPDFAYINMLDIWQFLLSQQRFLLRPRLKLLKKPLLSYVSGMPLPRYWPFEQLFNRHVQQLFEFGFHEYFMRCTTEFAIKTGYLRFFQTEYNRVVPLNLYDFEMPALLLVVGYLLALMVLLMELVWCRLQGGRV